MPETSLPVRHLFKIVIETDTPSLIPGAPQGDRMVVGITGGHFEGTDLSGIVMPPGGDWVTQRADGSIKLDVKMMLKTNDDALIYVSYFGVGAVEEGELKVRSTPLFETGDERYAWLNNVQGVGIGGADGSNVVYDMYALL
ncbi:MAG: DUF3237 domain-containing protein [bacterium]|nr:DUF3237 domain-containing protein [bacterium]